MIRWLTCLLFVCFLWLGGIEPSAICESRRCAIAVTPNTQTPEQLKQGEKIAQKAIKATEKGNFSQAEVYWTELIASFPDNPAVWSNRGNVRIAQDKLEDAIADFNQSIEIAPQYPDPYLNRGIAYERQQQWELALTDYNQALAINPQDSVAYNNRGNAKAGQEKWQEALTDYQKAVELAPDFSLARANLALVTYQVGENQEALRQMRNLVRKYPMFPDMRAAITAVLWINGNQGEAESNWVAAVGLDPRYQNLDWLTDVRRWPPAMISALERFLNLT